MKSLFLSVSVAATLFTAPFAIADDMTPSQEKQLIEISDLLKKHPKLIDGLHANLQLYVDSQKAQRSLLEEHHDYLYNNPKQPYFGAEQPKLTIINFTDYNCPYCKRLESGLMNIVKRYPEIRVVNVLLPFQQRMISDLNTNTAWYALNVWENQPDKFAEVHRLMMAKPSKHDKASLLKIAELTKTKAQLSSEKEKAAFIQKNEDIFKQLGLRGTPSLIIGDQIIPGFIPENELEQALKSQLQ